jgi:hypothetical protein
LVEDGVEGEVGLVAIDYFRTWVDLSFYGIGLQEIVAKAVDRSTRQLIEPLGRRAQRHSLLGRRSLDEA